MTTTSVTSPASSDLDRELVRDTKETRALAKRIQIDFAPDTWDLLEQLKDRTHASSKAEVIRRAIALYDWISEQIKSDDVLTITDKNGDTKFRIPGKTFIF